METIDTRRITILDEVRGFAVVCMIFFHAFYTLTYYFGSSVALELMDFFKPAVPWFGGAFILISGISSRLSHSNLVRGARLFGIALALTAVTWVLDRCFGIEGSLITFGILHMLSLSMLLYAALHRLWNKVPLTAAVAVCVVLFAVTYNINYGYIGIGPLSFELPESIMHCRYLFPFGITTYSYESADYYPLIPWVFAFFAGAATGKPFAERRLPEFCFKPHVRPLSFCGQHALIIYLVHQPVIFGLAELISLILR